MWPWCAHAQPCSQHTERFPAPFGGLILSIPPLPLPLPRPPKGRGALRGLCCHPGTELLLLQVLWTVQPVQPLQLPTPAPAGGHRLFPAQPGPFPFPFPSAWLCRNPNCHQLPRGEGTQGQQCQGPAAELLRGSGAAFGVCHECWWLAGFSVCFEMGR